MCPLVIWMNSDLITESLPQCFTCLQMIQVKESFVRMGDWVASPFIFEVDVCYFCMERNLLAGISCLSFVVMNTDATEATEATISLKTERLPSYWDQIKVPGFQPFMSTSGPENHLEQCISEQMTPCNPRISHDNAKNSDILEEITEFLLSDSQLVSASDEQHLMPRVDSLCCLLERDLASAGNLQTKSFIDLEVDDDGSIGENKSISRAACLDKFVESFPVPKDLSDSISSCEQAPTTSSKDSFGELLLDLPRIDSLPKLFYNT